MPTHVSIAVSRVSSTVPVVINQLFGGLMRIICDGGVVSP